MMDFLRLHFWKIWVLVLFDNTIVVMMTVLSPVTLVDNIQLSTFAQQIIF